MRRFASLMAAVLVCGAACSVGLAQPPAGTDPAVPGERTPRQAEPNPPRELRPQPGATPSGWTPPKPEVSPIDPALDVGAALDAAKGRAKAAGRRVLVIWSADQSSNFNKQMVDLSRTNSLQRLLGLEYETVWADAAKGPKAEANRTLAKSLGADLKAEDQHPALQVLDAEGRSVAVQRGADFVDASRPRSYSPLKVEDFLNKNRAAAPKAQELVGGALAKAQVNGKFALVWFGEFGDAWSGQFGAWLAQPEVVRALGKYAEVTHIELVRDVGAPGLLENLGGVHVQSLPWFAIVAADGKVLGMSQSEKIPNIGFPTDDVEIGQFLDLLRRGAPKLADEDAQAIRASLVEHRTRKR